MHVDLYVDSDLDVDAYLPIRLPSCGQINCEELANAITVADKCQDLQIFLFFSGLQLIGWSPPTLGRATALPSLLI